MFMRDTLFRTHKSPRHIANRAAQWRCHMARVRERHPELPASRIVYPTKPLTFAVLAPHHGKPLAIARKQGTLLRACCCTFISDCIQQCYECNAPETQM